METSVGGGELPVGSGSAMAIQGLCSWSLGAPCRGQMDLMTIEIGRELPAMVGQTDSACALLLSEKAGSSRAGNWLLEGSFLSLGSLS